MQFIVARVEKKIKKLVSIAQVFVFRDFPGRTAGREHWFPKLHCRWQTDRRRIQECKWKCSVFPNPIKKGKMCFKAPKPYVAVQFTRWVSLGFMIPGHGSRHWHIDTVMCNDLGSCWNIKLFVGFFATALKTCVLGGRIPLKLRFCNISISSTVAHSGWRYFFRYVNMTSRPFSLGRFVVPLQTTWYSLENCCFIHLKMIYSYTRNYLKIWIDEFSRVSSYGLKWGNKLPTSRKRSINSVSLI